MTSHFRTLSSCWFLSFFIRLGVKRVEFDTNVHYKGWNEKHCGTCSIMTSSLESALCVPHVPLFLPVMQRDCLHFSIVAKPSERFMPEDPNTWQYRIWRIVDSSPFEYFIMTLIALNTLILMMKVGSKNRIFVLKTKFRYKRTSPSHIRHNTISILIKICSTRGRSDLLPKELQNKTIKTNKQM